MFNEKLTQRTNEDISYEIKPYPACGKGDCVFYAILGAWNAERRYFKYQNVEDAYGVLANKIRNCQAEDILFKAIEKAIQKIIISQRQGGIEIENFRTEYKKYLKENEKKNQFKPEKY